VRSELWGLGEGGGGGWRVGGGGGGGGDDRQASITNMSDTIDTLIAQKPICTMLFLYLSATLPARRAASVG